MNVWAQIIKDQSQTPQNQENDQGLPPISETPSVLLRVCMSSKKNPRGRWNTRKILYNWNKVEDRKYIDFLKKNKDLFNLSKYDRKCIKINVIMSEKIKSRSAAQCHTHHQKMMHKFGTIDNIIHSYQLLMQSNRPAPSVSPLGQAPLKPNQSCISLQPQDGENDEEFCINKEPYWLRYADLFSVGERSYFHEENSQN